MFDYRHYAWEGFVSGVLILGITDPVAIFSWPFFIPIMCLSVCLGSIFMRRLLQLSCSLASSIFMDRVLLDISRAKV